MSGRYLTWADDGRTLADCPLCGQVVRVDLQGDRLAVQCFGGCDEAAVLGSLDGDRVTDQLRAQNAAGSRAHAPGRVRGGDRALAAESFALIQAERTRWLWDRRVPLGTATLLVGREKLGKSTLTVELAARLSRGDLEGDLAPEPADTLLVSYEDSAARTIKPRLMAAGADLARVHRIIATRGDTRDLVSLPADVDRIGELAREHGARLVVVDPLSASLTAEVDSHRDQDIRRALAPLVQLAEEDDLAVLALAHFNKGQGTDSLSRVLGSRGLTAAVRSVLAFGRPSDTEEGSADRVLAHPASNLGLEAASLACRIEAREVDADDGERIETSRLVIVGECETQAHDLLAGAHIEQPGELEEAVEFLEGQLAEGECPSREVKAAWKREGGSERTLQRAARKLDVEEDARGFPRRTYWRLPVAPAPRGATGEREGGATDETRSVEGKTEDSRLQSRQHSCFGATERDEWSDEAATNLVRIAGGAMHPRTPGPTAGLCECGRPTSPTYARCLPCDMEAA